MSLELYPFQAEGSRWLAARTRGYLGDEMGLGKTVQAITAARQAGARSALTVAPASVVGPWEDAWAAEAPEVNAKVVSYDRVRAASRVRARDVLVFDEAHYLKNPAAKRTKAALAFAAPFERVYLLSGTPTPNHPGELYPVLEAFWPELLPPGGFMGFMRRYTKFRRTEYGIQPYKIRNAGELKRLLAQMMLRRRLGDVALDLPPMRVHTQRLTKGPDLDAALRAAGLDPLNLESLSTEEHMATLRRVAGRAKAPYVAQLLAEELQDGQVRKVVVLGYHHETLDLVRDQLSPFGLVELRGGASQAARRHAVAAFTDDPGTLVFLGQQGAAGTGLNLQAASEIVLLEPDWSPEMNAQYLKRIHRIGQTLPCRARIFTLRGSLDDGLLRALARKTEMAVQAGLN